jgi:hypothetical protein
MRNNVKYKKRNIIFKNFRLLVKVNVIKLITKEIQILIRKKRKIMIKNIIILIANKKENA